MAVARTPTPPCALIAASTGDYLNGSEVPALPGRIVKFGVAALRDEKGKVDSEALAGLVRALSGGPVELHSTTVRALGSVPVFAWTGRGRVSDVRRSWERFATSSSVAPTVLLPRDADASVLELPDTAQLRLF